MSLKYINKTTLFIFSFHRLLKQTLNGQFFGFNQFFLFLSDKDSYNLAIKVLNSPYKDAYLYF